MNSDAGSGSRLSPETTQSKALRLLKSIYDETRGSTVPGNAMTMASVFGWEVEDLEAAFRYLTDKGLIKRFAVPFMARVTAAGIDTIESAQRHPDKPAANFGSVTYNMYIGSMVNSQAMQASPHATQQLHVDDGLKHQVLELLTDIRARLDVLPLSQSAKDEVRANVDTVEPQLRRPKPSIGIVRESLDTIKSVLDGIAGAEAIISKIVGLLRSLGL